MSQNFPLTSTSTSTNNNTLAAANQPAVVGSSFSIADVSSPVVGGFMNELGNAATPVATPNTNKVATPINSNSNFVIPISNVLQQQQSVINTPPGTSVTPSLSNRSPVTGTVNVTPINSSNTSANISTSTPQQRQPPLPQQQTRSPITPTPVSQQQQSSTSTSVATTAASPSTKAATPITSTSGAGTSTATQKNTNTTTIPTTEKLQPQQTKSSSSSHRTFRVGEYDLGKELGTGSSCIVRMCRHIPSGVYYAAKIIPRGNREEEENLKREVRALSKIDNEHVVQYRQLLLSAHNYYVIMEAALGGDLLEKILSHKNGMQSNEVRRLFTQLVRGLTACHMAKVAHRDLKPENILLTRDGNIKLSDFGVSRFHKGRHKASPDDYSTTFVGTIEYAAPEVFGNEGYDGFRADMWSLGCVLHAMLSGRFPFGFHPTKQELIESIATGKYVPLPASTDPLAVNLVCRLIVVEPSERLTCIEVMNHEFLLSASSSSANTSGNLLVGTAPTTTTTTTTSTSTNTSSNSNSASAAAVTPVGNTAQQQQQQKSPIVIVGGTSPNTSTGSLGQQQNIINRSPMTSFVGSVNTNVSNANNNSGSIGLIQSGNLSTHSNVSGNSNNNNNTSGGGFNYLNTSNLTAAGLTTSNDSPQTPFEEHNVHSFAAFHSSSFGAGVGGGSGSPSKNTSAVNSNNLLVNNSSNYTGSTSSSAASSGQLVEPQQQLLLHNTNGNSPSSSFTGGSTTNVYHDRTAVLSEHEITHSRYNNNTSSSGGNQNFSSSLGGGGGNSVQSLGSCSSESLGATPTGGINSNSPAGSLQQSLGEQIGRSPQNYSSQSSSSATSTSSLTASGGATNNAVGLGQRGGIAAAQNAAREMHVQMLKNDYA